LATCHQWNCQRARVVPAAVIDDGYTTLQQFPPHPAEGFLAVYPLAPDCPLSTIAARLSQLKRSLTNRSNRTQHRQVDWHRYSGLLDFDRLLHLISLLVAYPGLGDFYKTEPTTLQTLVNQSRPRIVDALDEICAVMAHQRGAVYADPAAIGQDLDWLEANGFLSPKPQTAALTLPLLECKEKDDQGIDSSQDVTFKPGFCHAYSDWEAFQRLLTTVRFIAHHPFTWDVDQQSSLKSLLSALQQQGLLQGDRQAAVRKDFEQVLKPFGILPNFRMRRGYFIGSGVLSEQDLLKVASLLQAQAKTIQDPAALGILDTLQERLQRSRHDLANLYPVRAIGNRTIVDTGQLPVDALAKTLERLETEIETGQLLELNHFTGVGRFEYHPDGFFRAWPLQMVFHNIGWYLGYEIADGSEQGLLQFERLDRLFRGRPQGQQRSRADQERSLRRLQRLYQSCAGLYLGHSASAQQRFLSRQPTVQATASIRLELWFTDSLFAFISEGTQRFPVNQMKMSPKLSDPSPATDGLFCLLRSNDPRYPNRLQVQLPIWSVDDLDLRRWILGFGDSVRVVLPTEIVNRVRQVGEAISALYGSDSD
jgi:hypothetical protein